MSGVRHRFFQITTGPFVDRFLELRKQRKVAAQSIKSFMADVGADECYGTGPASYMFDFSDAGKVDMQAWAKTKPRRGTYYFRPRRNTEAGKAIAARIKLLPECPDAGDAMELTGLDYRFPIVIDGDRGYRPYIRFFSVKDPLAIIVSVPWRDYSEKELAKYKKDREAGTHLSSSLDHALWAAPEWMTEIKEWEALKIIEERSAKTGVSA